MRSPPASPRAHLPSSRPKTASTSRPPTTQTETDEYTRYELLAPDSGKFKITYEVTATTAGAKYYYNPIRKGSAATDESVLDAMTGKPLHFEVVSGADARKDALMADADLDTELHQGDAGAPGADEWPGTPHHPQDLRGQRRATTSTARRSCSIGRSASGATRSCCRAGYEVVGLTVPSQILTEGGRPNRDQLRERHRRSRHRSCSARPKARRPEQRQRRRPPTKQRSWESPFEGETEEDRLSERAHQDRDIVYFLQQPETHAFALYHDYTESRPGINGYANVVRKGSTASSPSASILDTGEQLQAKEMSGAEMTALEDQCRRARRSRRARRRDSLHRPCKQDSRCGLRIAETYTAPVSYRLDGDDLVFDRSLGRPRNAVVLPSGWYCTFSSIPATVSQLPDGRVRLDYWNGRPEPVDVLLKARRRVAP